MRFLRNGSTSNARAAGSRAESSDTAALRATPSAKTSWFGSHSSTSQLDALLQAASEHSIIATDLVGLITVFSAGAQRLLGYQAKEVVGRRTPELFHDRAEVAARAQVLGCAPGFEVFVVAARLGGVETRDWTYINRAGHRMTVSLSVTGIRDERGLLVGFIGIATDVTLARAAHQAVITQRETYHSLIKNLPFTTVGLADAELTWIALSGYSVETSGYSEAHFIGQPVGSSLGRVDAERLRALVRDADIAPAHADLKTADGRWYEIDAIAVPATGHATKEQLLIVIRDVTERRAAERAHRTRDRALTISEGSFKAAFDDAPAPAALVHTGDQDRPPRLARANLAFAALLGRAPDDLAGVTLTDIVHPDDHHTLQAEHPGSNAPLRYRHASGRWIWVEIIRADVADTDGRVRLRVDHVLDLTARLAQDQALLDALEQRQAALTRQHDLEKMRTELLANLSHELRSPLTNIRGYLELALEDTTPALNDAHRTMLDTALRNTERLQRCTDDLLSVASSPIPVLPGEPATLVDLSRVLADIVAEAQPTTTLTDPVITLDVPGKPVWITADEHQIHRAISNIIANALRYSTHDPHVRVILKADDLRAHLSIFDNGIGIPIDEHDHVFTRRYRATSAEAASIHGSGLGLAITRTIIENLGGKVAVDPLHTPGTRIAVLLPVHTEH